MILLNFAPLIILLTLFTLTLSSPIIPPHPRLSQPSPAPITRTRLPPANLPPTRVTPPPADFPTSLPHLRRNEDGESPKHHTLHTILHNEAKVTFKPTPILVLKRDEDGHGPFGYHTREGFHSHEEVKPTVKPTPIPFSKRGEEQNHPTAFHVTLRDAKLNVPTTYRTFLPPQSTNINEVREEELSDPSGHYTIFPPRNTARDVELNIPTSFPSRHPLPSTTRDVELHLPSSTITQWPRSEPTVLAAISPFTSHPTPSRIHFAPTWLNIPITFPTRLPPNTVRDVELNAPTTHPTRRPAGN